jgi:hypothetical protein
LAIGRKDTGHSVVVLDPRERPHLVRPAFVAHGWPHHLAGSGPDRVYEPMSGWPLRPACLLGTLRERTGRTWPAYEDGNKRIREDTENAEWKAAESGRL